MFAAVSAWGQSHSTKRPTATVITVTAGKPTELGFKLSKFSNIPAGTVTFKVTNQGLAFHSFKLCTTPVATAAKNSCTGVVTKILKHGQSATLTVKLTKTGKYEFLCTVPGHASAGMKGLLGIGVAVKATTTAKTTSSTTTTAALTGGGSSSTTTTASGGATSGNNAPPSGPDGCPGGTSIQANLITTGGDGDVDDSGGQSDMDGCV
ncbi:MAG TPA: plastocyanin/azurin family copper-binding protein [Gaiellaceae bacterium]|nr:plastocyanin/azurin family copper-binding protein [Gaiellaceae bacterium]